MSEAKEEDNFSNLDDSLPNKTVHGMQFSFDPGPLFTFDIQKILQKRDKKLEDLISKWPAAVL